VDTRKSLEEKRRESAEPRRIGRSTNSRGPCGAERTGARWVEIAVRFFPAETKTNRREELFKSSIKTPRRFGESFSLKLMEAINRNNIAAPMV